MQYSEMFKRKMIQKLTGPGALSASALARQEEPSQVTLSKWLREAGVESPYIYSNKAQEDTALPKSPKKWSAEEKFKIVLEAASIPEDQLGAFLRSKGLHETHLQQWRLLMLDGLQNSSSPEKKTKTKLGDNKKIKELEKELNRKDKALAETAALLVLKKKVQAIWGDEDDDTPKKNGK